MPKIQILSDTLISQIAAGEVVERPASVVKELVENSIDAGATECAIEIEQGGTKLIAVADNGCGMSPQDAPAAFLRHATSKIATFEDLHSIATFGFRGEALAAIASVAHVQLKTRQPQASSGFAMEYRGGSCASQSTIGCPPGTHIAVRSLFFNTPARKKFLKTETTELVHIIAVINQMALSHRAVGFSLKHNGKTLLQVFSTNFWQERIAALLGQQTMKEATAVEFVTLSLKISGFIGSPGMSMRSKRHQYLFVNGRPVNDSAVTRAVIDGYGSLLPARSYPFFILNLTLPPADVDVNVHPRKLTVRFLEPHRIYRDVMQAVRQGLGRNAGMEKWKNGQEDVTMAQNTVQDALQFTEHFLGEREKPVENLGVQVPGNLPLAYFANSYILVSMEDGLMLVDQHAAHERIMYERFCARQQTKLPTRQKLLSPILIECSTEEMILLENLLPLLASLGFEIEKWSGATCAVHACPPELKHENLISLIRGILEDAPHGKILPDRMLKSLACKAAVKFGMPLAQIEQQNLLSDLQKTPNNSTCPHGRPVKLLLTFGELEQRFYRKK